MEKIELIEGFTLVDVTSGGGGRGYWTNFYTGRFRPEVQPLTVLYTIFARKRTPCVYLPSQHTCMNSSTSSTQPFPRRCGEQLASQKEESEKQQARSARREWWEPGRIKVGKWNERVRARRCDAVDWDSVWKCRLFSTSVRAMWFNCSLDTAAVTELWRLQLFSCTSSSFLSAGTLSLRGKCC